MLLSNHYFDGGDYSGCVAQVGPSEENAFGIVEIRFGTGPTFIFQHEMGHLFGANHERGRPFDEPCAYAWKVKYPYYTVVHGETYYRIPHYSDPNIYWAGFPTGKAPPIESNNAGKIRTTGCDVAGFSGNHDLVIMIDGPDDICNGPHTYTAITPGAPAPYDYQWYWNTDGIFTPQNPGTFLGNSASLSIPPPPIASCTSIFLRVIVSHLGEVVGDSVKRISNKDCHECFEN